MTTYNDTALAYSAPSHRPIADFGRAIMNCFDGWLQRHTVRAELERLDSRTLADLGINRGDFPSIAAGTYRHPSEW